MGHIGLNDINYAQNGGQWEGEKREWRESGSRMFALLALKDFSMTLSDHTVGSSDSALHS